LNDWIDFYREPGAFETRPYRRFEIELHFETTGLTLLLQDDGVGFCEDSRPENRFSQLPPVWASKV
jgi:hypothetical protein